MIRLDTRTPILFLATREVVNHQQNKITYHPIKVGKKFITKNHDLFFREREKNNSQF